MIRRVFNPLMPTVAIWLRLCSTLCQTGLAVHGVQFLISGHFEAQGGASRVLGFQKLQMTYWWYGLTRCGNRMLHCRSTHMATVGIKGLISCVSSKVLMLTVLMTVCRCDQPADCWCWWSRPVDAACRWVLSRNKSVTCAPDCCWHQCMYCHLPCQ